MQNYSVPKGTHYLYRPDDERAVITHLRKSYMLAIFEAASKLKHGRWGSGDNLPHDSDIRRSLSYWGH